MFKCDWPECPSEWEQPELAAEFETLRSVRAVCNKALDIARSEKAIRSSLEASVTITTDSPHLLSLLTKHEEDAHGKEFPLHKCPHCWKYTSSVEDSLHV